MFAKCDLLRSRSGSKVAIYLGTGMQRLDFDKKMKKTYSWHGAADGLAVEVQCLIGFDEGSEFGGVTGPAQFLTVLSFPVRQVVQTAVPLYQPGLPHVSLPREERGHVAVKVVHLKLIKICIPKVMKYIIGEPL